MDQRLTGHRRPRWRTELLDSEDRPKRDITPSAGRIELAATTRLGASGSMSLVGSTADIDWMRDRVRFTYDPGILGVDPWPVATLLLSSPTEDRTDLRTAWEVELLSKLAVLDEDAIHETFSLAAGTPIVPAVVDLIRSAGETRIAVTESDTTLANPQVWPASTPKLTIINDLLQAAGYWSLWADGAGLFRVEPYRAPGDRAVSWVFAAGEAAIHTPDWGREQDLASVPNRYIVVGQGSDDTPPLVGVASNEDADSPFGYEARGRWITRTEEGVEGSTQTVFDQLAQRRLADAMSPVAKLDATHAIIPLNPNDLVEFAPTTREPVRATVQRMAYTLGFDAQCSAEWREA
ncbi:hypothetical protein K8P10_001994 [Leucobacter sp. Psy1]|uniref:hypothetical protein n=1 Tax=Leucobacter sp. Psy1 TaxID=2875729 RepID=UPI001CD20F45|nr:hypothetical protein [Leucobacter sp. Psy1]UBH06483.1 hypothetical protein K8P10_001994 [Leucobacter sp. Psy1]